jgi:hypothetical protein
MEILFDEDGAGWHGVSRMSPRQITYPEACCSARFAGMGVRRTAPGAAWPSPCRDAELGDAGVEGDAVDQDSAEAQVHGRHLAGGDQGSH